MNDFLTKYNDLKRKYPLLAIVGNGNDNSDYGNYLFECRNTYYSFDTVECSDSYYIFDSEKIESSMEMNFCENCQNCYEITDAGSLYNCTYVSYSARCYDCHYSMNLADCHDCFGCVNLTHKSYCIFNKQYSKDEYLQKINEFKGLTAEEVMEKVLILEKKFPKLSTHAEQIENSDFCDYIFRSQNCYYCFDCTDLEDSGYLFKTYNTKNCWDGSNNARCQLCYEINDCVDCYNCNFAEQSARCYDSSFLYNCADCNNCFGCTNLSNKSYCILNKQYTETEYFEKVKELKKELGWGSPIKT